jgi:hypothetical protein
MFETNIEILEIIIAALASMFIGMMWYSGAMFGKAWLKLVGIKQPKPHWIHYVSAFIISIIASVVLTFFIGFLQYPTPGGGVVLGFFAWLGFIATTSMNPVIWEGQNIRLFLINNSSALAQLLVMGLILGALA